MRFRLTVEVEYTGTEDHAGAEAAMASAMTFMAGHDLMIAGLDEGACVKELAFGLQRLTPTKEEAASAHSDKTEEFWEEGAQDEQP